MHVCSPTSHTTTGPRLWTRQSILASSNRWEPPRAPTSIAVPLVSQSKGRVMCSLGAARARASVGEPAGSSGGYGQRDSASQLPKRSRGSRGTGAQQIGGKADRVVAHPTLCRASRGSFIYGLGQLYPNTPRTSGGCRTGREEFAGAVAFHSSACGDIKSATCPIPFHELARDPTVFRFTKCAMLGRELVRVLRVSNGIQLARHSTPNAGPGHERDDSKARWESHPTQALRPCRPTITWAWHGAGHPTDIPAARA